MTFLFNSPDCEVAIQHLKRISGDNLHAVDSELKKWAQLIWSNKSLFDPNMIQNLEDNIVETKKWNLFSLANAYEEYKENTIEYLKVSSIILYIYLKELNFRTGRMEDPITQRTYDNINKLKELEYDKYQTYFDYIDELPYRLCREIYTNPKLNEIRKFLEEKDFGDFKNLIRESENASDLINSWQSTYEVKLDEIKRLEKKLDEYKTTYDFVLLNKGFQQLYGQKKEDLKNPVSNYKWISIFIIAIPILEIIFFSCLIAKEIPINSTTIWYMVIPSISLILFLFYFYRINLQEARSIKSQMMQLELRMALCQFIHNYADDSEKLHIKNGPGFEKFENIIFSPLVSSDDKIPTTFDGMEQLANLVSQFKNK